MTTEREYRKIEMTNERTRTSFPMSVNTKLRTSSETTESIFGKNENFRTSRS